MCINEKVHGQNLGLFFFFLWIKIVVSRWRQRRDPVLKPYRRVTRALTQLCDYTVEGVRHRMLSHLDISIRMTRVAPPTNFNHCGRYDSLKHDDERTLI